MADFQCLAMHSEGGKNTSLYDKIILRKVESQAFFEQDLPYFLPPAIFSRLDTPVDYFYRPDIHQKPITGKRSSNNINLIGLNRTRRRHNAIFVSFTEPSVPTKCLEGAITNWEQVCQKDHDKQAEEQLRKMFESRPIWSRNAVKANINIQPDKLKLLLPVVAYYMVTGPWRSLWVRFGYDPRKMKDSKKYQLLDFRIRCSTKHGYSSSDMPVKPKRSALNYNLPITVNKTVPQPASLMELTTQEGPSTSRDTASSIYQLKESSYIFREGMLPPHRQMFYQLCDLDVESIRQVVDQNTGEEQVCEERDGWCVPGTKDKLRDMISGMIKKVVRGQKPALLVHSQKRRRRGLLSLNHPEIGHNGNVWDCGGCCRLSGDSLCHLLSTGLPVMLWIYGGGFLAGGSMGANFLDNYLYSGQEIAERGEVIVVTVGYRVGTLGFLSTGDSSLPGNYGLWDQHAAIAWVHRNIRLFGGDPDNITIFGESAGGASVSFQTLSPHNKGLVRRAISQSGDALSPWAVNEDPRTMAERVALKAGCPVDERMVACLRSSDARNLTMSTPYIPDGTPDYPGIKHVLLTPVVDGDFLPDEPVNLFHNTAEIDYLAGVNDMDGFSFTSEDIHSLKNKTEKTPVDEVIRLLAAYTKDTGPEGFQVASDEYFSKWGASPSQETVQRTAVEIGTDYIFLVSTQAALYLHAAKATSAGTFSYLLSEPSLLAGPGRPYPDWMGADHTDDLQYVFGIPFAIPQVYGDKQRELSGNMIAYWTNFARTGNPNKGTLKVPVTWPNFTSAGQQFLDISAKMSESSIGEKMRHNFVRLWTKTLPGLKSHIALDN
uniref:Bile salt-activated lipase n=1 Tax=Takifugu rubripes TaxID=31033 RepID=H2RZP3_TAKRU